jgi:sodium transport system permease protein
MRWSNVRLIFRKEVRDQLRDRRTLFMILVLPVLLYPIMGFGIAQLSVLFEQKPRTVVLVGEQNLPEEPPLVNAERNGFDMANFEPATEEEAGKLKVKFASPRRQWEDPKLRKALMRAEGGDAVVLIPKNVRSQLESGRAADMPIVYDSADESSQITYLRVKNVLDRWSKRILARMLAAERKSPEFAEPVAADPMDVATESESSGSIWAKLFPFLLVLMSLTGAFYPAIDLCAGEKERGTMETLLISPASRTEIVMGKFFTVMLASIATALLNLASMAVTGFQLARQIGGMGAEISERMSTVIRPPTFASGCWMFLILIPLSAFFSALCLSLAVLARSMKEGQYYMTPLYIAALPLIFATLIPGIDLNLFTSLLPITGVSLLLRSLMQRDYDAAWQFFLPVLLPTLVYGALALRWAVDQFQREEVLFRDAERFDLASWLRHLIRDREPTPSAAQALLCFAIMICAAWFLMSTTAGRPSSVQLVIGQVAFILAPPLLMAVLLTTSPMRTLRLAPPNSKYLLMAFAFALAVNPVVAELRRVIEQLFPISESLRVMMTKMFTGLGGGGLGMTFLLLAVVPAICEEFAFRGYILSGFQRDYRPWTCILLQAFLFGLLHVLLSLFHQFFNSMLLGIILGLLAIKTRSIWPGILFHMTNNGLAVVLSHVAEGKLGSQLVGWIYRKPSEGLYHVPLIVVGAVVSASMIVALARTANASKKTSQQPIDTLAHATS